MRLLSRLLLRLTQSVESELLASNALLIAQIKALQTQLGKPPRLTDAQKIELARLAKGLSPETREQMCLVARPSTMLGWYRRLIARQYDGSSQRRGPGRPRLRAQTEALILSLSGEVTPSRIVHGNILIGRDTGLGRVGDETVLLNFY